MSNEKPLTIGELAVLALEPFQEFTSKLLKAAGFVKPYIAPVHAEMRYGTVSGFVQTDLDPADREALHSALDEWLNRSLGTGYFYVGNLTQLRNDLEEL